MAVNDTPQRPAPPIGALMLSAFGGLVLAAGVLALGMRVQLAAPMQDFLGVDTDRSWSSMVYRCRWDTTLDSSPESPT